MLGGLGDPYTTYLSADAIRALDEELKGGNFGGIGVYIGKDPKSGAILVDPIEGNPAIRAGRAHRRRDRRRRQPARPPACRSTTSSAAFADRAAPSSRCA